MISWAIETFVAVNLLLLGVLLVRRPVAASFGAGWAYALWLLPLLRAVMPPLGIADVPSVLPVSVLISSGERAIAPMAGSGGPENWAPMMLFLWGGGAALFILWQLAAYRHFIAQLSGSLRTSYPAEHEGVPVLESRAVDGPIAIGLIDPRIVVPIDFLSRYSQAEQHLALAHERIHHRRGDLWWNGLALILLALNCFNPLAWLAFRAFRADQELACDAAVAARTAPTERHDYASALVKSASRSGLIAACPLNSTEQLKRRLRMMKHHRVTRARTIGGAAIFALLTAVGLAATHGPALAEEVKEIKKIHIIKKVDKDGNVTTHGDPAVLADIERTCEGDKAERKVESGEGDKKHVTRVIICSKGDAVAQGELNDRLASALEKARDRVSKDEEISPERRAKILAELQAEIDRVRSRK